jgi:hypothetical protein
MESSLTNAGCILAGGRRALLGARRLLPVHPIKSIPGRSAYERSARLIFTNQNPAMTKEERNQLHELADALHQLAVAWQNNPPDNVHWEITTCFRQLEGSAERLMETAGRVLESYPVAKPPLTPSVL